MKIAVPDLISNSYLPAPAAVELGFLAAEGIDVSWEMIAPVERAMEALRDDEVQFVAGSSHSTLAAFPGWEGAKVLVALAHGMYWLLVLRSDLGAARGDLEAVKGRRIGAAPWVGMGFRGLLRAAGVDPERDGVDIVPVPGASRPGVSFGVNAARALEAGEIDGFWANAMGAEVAVRSGTGTVVLDVRRGEGPTGAFDYTWPVVVTSDAVIARDPDAVSATVRAVVKTQRALVADVGLATKVGERLFPAAEAAMIADVVARDLPFYRPEVPQAFVEAMNRFAVDLDLLDGPVAYEQVVATRFADLWSG